MLFCSSNVAVKEICLTFYYRGFKHKTKQFFLSVLSEEEIVSNKVLIIHSSSLSTLTIYNLLMKNKLFWWSDRKRSYSCLGNLLYQWEIHFFKRRWLEDANSLVTSRKLVTESSLNNYIYKSVRVWIYFI